MSKQAVTAVFIVGLLVIFDGCQPSPEDARKELGQLGIEYTPEAFIQAAGNNDSRAVELFLLAGIDPDVKSDGLLGDGKTALVRAAEAGHTQIVQILLANEANPNVQTGNLLGSGKTALMRAAEVGHATIAQVLLTNEADPDIQDWRGKTALMWAAEEGYIQIVQALLANGANPNVQTDLLGGGKTALMQAAGAGHTEIVRTLLTNGANPDVQDWRGRTALDIAKVAGKTKSADILRAIADGDTMLIRTGNETTPLPFGHSRPAASAEPDPPSSPLVG